MRHYLISGDHVTPCFKPPIRLAKGNLLVASAQDIEHSDFTLDRLQAIHGTLPGAGNVAKARSRKAAVGRLWAALQTLPSKQTSPSKKQTRKPRTSKQARVVEMLRRREGATVAAIAKKMGWQHHTVRGLIAGAIKKKLGLTIFSESGRDGIRVYRIAGSNR